MATTVSAHGAAPSTANTNAVSAFSPPGSKSANFARAVQSSDPFAPCDPPGANATACENSKPGNPASQWDINGAGAANIQGFATDISVNRGETVQFKINTNSNNYRLDIYRLGYYGGLGARLITTVQPSAALPQAQPACLTQPSTGLIDCGNWAQSASWAVPLNATSGIYIAKLVREDATSGSSHIVFIVRNDTGASNILFQTSDTTWQAYNSYGGNSLYVGSPDGRAYKVSYNRPFNTRAGSTSHDWVFDAEYPMVRFLEANGYDVSYSTGVDTDRRGAEILEHNVFLSVGHDEYWSGTQRANVEAARNAGVHLAFFSGNIMFWKTRWENSIDGSGAAFRTLVCYKETHANAKIDPLPNVWTGTWRDPRFSPPADGGRPENALIGTIFTVNGNAYDEIKVPEALGKFRLWRNTAVANQTPGQTATVGPLTVGYEWDEDLNNGFRPSGLIRLSTNTVNVSAYLQDYGSTYGPGTATHSLTLYRHSSGAMVFSAAATRWSWGLDNNHDQSDAPTIPSPDANMRQATVNLFADMGVQPATLQPGLVASSQSTDTLPPTSTITSPAAGGTVALGSTVNITGTASDAGGGLVAGVNVSVDGGATWSAATGRSAWSYSWTPTSVGSVTIKSRAVDDSGNQQNPPAEITVTVVAQPCPCSVWGNGVTPSNTLENDSGAVELGLKFRSDNAGFITGVRFYKGGAANGGTHTGHLWTSSGTLLGSVTFGNETASGWQQALFPTPIQITANTTYVVSYFAPQGRYAADGNYFATSGADNGPLHALSNTLAGGNGVYLYGSTSGFPTNTFQSTNYWVDVVFNDTPPGPDTTPPTVTSFTPAAGATNVGTGANVTVTFSEAMNAATVNGSTVELRDPSNALVSAIVSYDAASFTATLDPTASLAAGTTYTARVRGGGTDPRVKDLAGNALAADVTWTFTTAAAPPPGTTFSIWAPATTPSNPLENDANAVELGLKFRADSDGLITGVRFYKGGAANGGQHVGHLWTSAGTLLGSVTFANETTSGWQQALFQNPITITANTTYVVSYFAPQGRYAADGNYFASSGVDNGPLHALSNALAGGNGVYLYGPTGGFPASAFGATNYWVDVVFSGSGSVPPQVVSTTPAPGATNVSTIVAPDATFSEALDPATVNTSTVLLRDAANNPVPVNVSYVSSSFTVQLSPQLGLQPVQTYTVTLKGGAASPHITDSTGTPLASDYSWSFTTGPASPLPAPLPILLITRSGNKFTQYYQEILRAEGLNNFNAIDLTQVTVEALAQYDVAILGEMPLTSTQVTMLSDWVAAGGNLIAMRPDKQLASLLGISDAASVRSDAYLLVNTAQEPGAGIVNQTIQYHSDADLYTLAGATQVAAIYSGPTQVTSNPAVTIRSVGTNGGQAAAFTFDLARSIVYTRQGNPAWAGQERDGHPDVIRPDDLFFPDYVNLDKVAIPQADELQRLLANMILYMNTDKRPLPRFWYFPNMKKAVVLMTGDDHATANGTRTVFNMLIAQSPSGCSVANWGCYRATSWIYTNSGLTNAQALAFRNQGFEMGVHVNTGCANWTPQTLDSFFTNDLASFAAKYTSIPAQKTNRTHCIPWSDWATHPKVELNHGIRLDENYYYWPPEWVQSRTGFMTGSGMPMRFADLDGSIIDVYQAATHLVNETDGSINSINSMLDKALGPEGYYGVFGTHYDYRGDGFEMNILNSAKARNVSLITAQQLLTWLDGRNTSSFGNPTWNGTQLGFSITVGTGANNLYAMVPNQTPGGHLISLTINGSPVTFTAQTIKGRSYAVFRAANGNAVATYAP